MVSFASSSVGLPSLSRLYSQSPQRNTRLSVPQLQVDAVLALHVGMDVLHRVLPLAGHDLHSRKRRSVHD